jgi:hypothetical protein
MRLPVVILLAALPVAGCAGEKSETASKGDYIAQAHGDSSGVSTADEGGRVAAGESLALFAAGVPEGGVAVPEATPRRVIYDANIRLVMEDITRAEKEIPELIEKYKGYLGDASVDYSDNLRNNGRWVAKVPSESLSAFVDEIGKLGNVENRGQTAQDVTDEYVDLEGRLATNRRLEARVVKHLETQAEKIADVLTVERELARIQAMIEQIEGRLKYLANRTTYATVTISVRQQQNYIAPEAVVFSDRVALSWQMSVRELRRAGEGIAVMAVVAAPWLVVLGIPFVLLLWSIRRRVRSRAARA